MQCAACDYTCYVVLLFFHWNDCAGGPSASFITLVVSSHVIDKPTENEGVTYDPYLWNHSLDLCIFLLTSTKWAKCEN